MTDTQPAKPARNQPCPAPDCGELVDTWLAGTTAAHRTSLGVMHADCYLAWRDTTGGETR